MKKPKRHRHEATMWVFARLDAACDAVSLLWCYQCGAIRVNAARGGRWQRPAGIGGENPAMREATR